MRCYRLLMWMNHTASPAPSLTRSQAPAQACFPAAQAPLFEFQAKDMRRGDNEPVKPARPPLVQVPKGRTGGTSGLHRAA
jgi:hypothetical protein